MKFTSEDLMKAMGLSVGDRVRVYNRIYELKKTYNGYFFDVVDKEIHKHNSRCALTELLNEEYEILPRPKRVGDLKCSNYVEDCSKCPVRVLCGDYSNEQDTFYEMLQGFVDLSGEFFDQEIHDLLKARLDKEVGYYER